MSLSILKRQPEQSPPAISTGREAVQTIETTGPSPLETGGHLVIDLAAIVHNWTSLRRRVVPADCAAVIKADAYGLGAAHVAAALTKVGCTTFFVAHLNEARKVRQVAPDAVIYVLNGFPTGSAAVFAELDARPVIGSLAEYIEWDAFRLATGWKGSMALHFDTGMNRLGLTPTEAPQFTARVKMPGHGISLIMSHLACADTPEHPLNAKQIESFRDLRFLFRGLPASLANSSGIFLGPAAHCDLARPGAALYGVNPTPATANLMEPVITLKTRIIQVREVPRGDTVGYGATWAATRPSRIAIVSVGYADGYPRAAGQGPRAQADTGPGAIVAGRRCPMVGRVSMDLMAFDVTSVPEELVQRGDEATLIGDGITVDDVATWSDTIGYEVLTNLGHRYQRQWVQ